MYLTFSIVINTLNRGTLLQKTLESFRWLKYPGDFEVIVVNGPSTDNSDEVIASWLPNIRTGKCSVANLSVSRNIGICMAQGDCVAFIDDDAIPEPEWLTQLAQAYRDPMVGAVGGLVYNHTGYDYQYMYCLIDRFANADLSLPGPTPHLSFPQSERFPHLLGCNASFRRSALLEIGGFDEEYEYFLDETDVCLRIVDAGYIIAQLPCAYVHHKFAPSNMRGENRVLRHRYPVIKNKMYFMLKHAREFYSLERILQEQQNFVQNHRNEVNWCIAEKFLSESDMTTFNYDLERALEVGLKRGLEGVAADAMIDHQKIKRHSGQFVPFKPIEGEAYRSIVLISRDFPPNHSGGIATSSKDLAEALAAEGNIVHVIVQSPDINRVDFENGVWVHRMVIREIPRCTEAIERKVPQHIWNWSAIALEEAKRIATHRSIDLVEAPIWDCEGVAFLVDGQWPLVTSLQTTLHFWLESHPEYKTDESWMTSFGNPMLALESELMTSACGVRASSQAIIQEIERAYDFVFDASRVKIVPYGIAARSTSVTFPIGNDWTEVLFVGRLEQRKGIDVLLGAIPQLLKLVPNVCFRIIGDDSLLGPSGKTYKERFFEEYAEKDFIRNVKFEGRVADETLQEAYARCDIFVAPSRFESFGLVFLEAMREGKSVIGCIAGGMPEIVSNGTNGILVEPGNTEALIKAILTLVKDESLRKAMGREGKRIFEENFTSVRMAKDSAGLYELAEKKFKVSSCLDNCDAQHMVDGVIDILSTSSSCIIQDENLIMEATPNLETVTSQVCTSSQFQEPTYKRICSEINQECLFHRKQWEYIYILRALEQFCMLQSGKSGLGFGCGKEPLAAVMAKRGATVMCTDIEPLERGDKYWGSTNVRDYFYEGICLWEQFESHVSFRPVDMNAIPNDLGLHDFIWSSCALEHLGSLQHGIDFVLDANKCLKPGGIAVHTTEFNVENEEETLESVGLSLYRKRDILRMKSLVEGQGNIFLPINFDMGDSELDKYVDIPPYNRNKHLKLMVEGKYVTTSIGFLVIKR